MPTQELFETPTTNFDERLLLAFLTDKLNLNQNRYQQILGIYGNLNSAISSGFIEMVGIGAKWLTSKTLEKNLDLSKIEENLNELQKNLTLNNIRILTVEDLEYPKSLKSLDNFPLVLFYQGNLELLNNPNMVTVVGSRNIDLYAKVVMDKILAPACRLGIGVVSGLAIGVDGYSHNIAIENNAPTIGVIGSGLDQKSFYPAGNWSLRNRILGVKSASNNTQNLEKEPTDILDNDYKKESEIQEVSSVDINFFSSNTTQNFSQEFSTNGLVLSEYPPNSKPNLYTFPQRNRLLAALTDLTWVVQASPKSGSLITSTRARDLNKTVATTPADIRNNDFGGNIELLKVGASIITETEDLLTLLNLKTHPEITFQNKIIIDSVEEQKIYNVLSLNPLEIEEIAIKSSLDTSTIITSLTLLELNSLAINVGENKWIKGG